MGCAIRGNAAAGTDDNATETGPDGFHAGWGKGVKSRDRVLREYKKRIRRRLWAHLPIDGGLWRRDPPSRKATAWQAFRAVGAGRGSATETPHLYPRQSADESSYCARLVVERVRSQVEANPNREHDHSRLRKPAGKCGKFRAQSQSARVVAPEALERRRTLELRSVNPLENETPR